MYKRYLEPEDESPLTIYMNKKIRTQKSRRTDVNSNISREGREVVSITDFDSIQGNETQITEEIIENEEVIRSDSTQEVEVETLTATNDEDDFFNQISEQLIHPNLLCKTADGICMILAFYLKHHLTWVALEDLLILFHNILGDDSNLPKTKYFFKKCFDSNNNKAVFHFFCKNCELYIGSYEKLKSLQDDKDKNDDRTSNTCHVCETEYSLKKMNEGNFFIQLPLRDQIEKKLSGNVDILNYNTSANSTDITDIFDGEQYKSLKAKVGTDKLVKLTINTDGVRVFKSKRKASLWPIQMYVNEVPPQKRFKQENIILNGLWFGKDPNFDVYFRPLIAELKDLDDNKIKIVVSGNETKTVSIRVIFVSADSPAKAKFQKLKQFNGEFGCGYCLHPGFLFGSSNSSKYTLSSAKYSERTHSSTVDLIKLVLNTGKETFGVMGVSPLIGFRDYDLIIGTVIDYLHCVLEGVTKLMLNLWFDSKNHREKYYITPRGEDWSTKKLKLSLH